jgi:hypothetical protein
VLAAIGAGTASLWPVWKYEGVLKEEADIRRFLQRAVACLGSGRAGSWRAAWRTARRC